MLARALRQKGSGASRCLFTRRLARPHVLGYEYGSSYLSLSTVSQGSPTQQRPVTNQPSTKGSKPPSKPVKPPPKSNPGKLLDSHSICYQQGSSAPSPVTKEDKHALAAAQRFFISGPGPNRFLYSAAKLTDHPPNPCVPEVLVLGASNAGKSTFLNALMGVQGVAMVGATPGSTKLQNVYAVGMPKTWDFKNLASWTKKPDTGLYLVDSPGYGYGSNRDWHNALEAYLDQRTSCRGVVLLLPLNKDIRRTDLDVLSHLAGKNKRTLVLLTKADTVVKASSPRKWAETADYLRESMKRINAKGPSSVAWTEGDAWNPDIYVIAAGMRKRTATSNTAGIGGARRVIMELAGYNLKGSVAEEDPSVVSYGGDIISFDDLQYK